MIFINDNTYIDIIDNKIIRIRKNYDNNNNENSAHNNKKKKINNN